MLSRTFAATIALALTAAPAAVLAAPGAYEPVAITVKVADLDPANAADRQTYETRLKAAARSVCRSGIDSLQAKAQEQRCFEEVVANGESWAN